MKKTILAGLLVIGAISFAANGTGARQGNRQPNGVSRMEANNGICTVTGTTTRANAGTFLGTGVKSGNTVAARGTKGVGAGQGAGMNRNGVAGRGMNRVQQPVAAN